MPPPNTTGLQSISSARINYTLILMMLMVGSMQFGASLIQMPTESLMRDAICYEYYGRPSNVTSKDIYCEVSEVQTELDRFKIISQVFQAAGGLLCAYPLGKLADQKGRRLLLVGGAAMWLLCYGILILSLGTVPMNMGWMMGLFIGGGKTVVEIMVFAIATDVSDDEMRSTFYANIISSALVGSFISQLVVERLHNINVQVPILIAIFPVALAAFIVFAIREPLFARREQYREQEELTPRFRPRRPLAQVLDALVSSRSLLLLVIAFITLPVATASLSSFEKYFPAAFGVSSVFKSTGYGPASFYFWSSFFAIQAINCAIIVSNCCLRRNTRRSTAQGDYIILFASAFPLMLGSLLLVCSDKGAAVAGLVFASLATGLFTHSRALLLYKVGAAMRTKFVGRMFAVTAMLQSAATMCLVPAMGFVTRSRPRDNAPMWILFAISGIILHASYFSRKALATSTPGPALGEMGLEDGIQLRDVDVPRMPPPAYSHGV